MCCRMVVVELFQVLGCESFPDVATKKVISLGVIQEHRWPEHCLAIGKYLC
jgi:hypothetical protein